MIQKIIIWMSATPFILLGLMILLSSVIFWGFGPGEPATGMSWEEYVKLKEEGSGFWSNMLIVGMGILATGLPIVIARRLTKTKKVPNKQIHGTAYRRP